MQRKSLPPDGGVFIINLQLEMQIVNSIQAENGYQFKIVINFIPFLWAKITDFQLERFSNSSDTSSKIFSDVFEELLKKIYFMFISFSSTTN